VFGVPKSLSIYLAITGDQVVENIARSAVDETMGAIESEMQCKVRKGGLQEDRRTGELLYSKFFHLDSRPINERSTLACPLFPSIGAEDHAVTVLRRMDLGAEACRDLLHYAPGQVVGFHSRTAGGFRPGEKWTVRETNCETVTLERSEMFERPKFYHENSTIALFPSGC
jgi:hypothetical protein